jgi:hypothetical protein
MLAITLGYAESGRTAVPALLYVGNDAAEAEAVFVAPPDGIVRTELFKNPVVTRRRFFDAVAAAAPEAPAEDASTPADEKPARRKA